MVFGEGDLSFTQHALCAPARGYSMYAFGGGGRITIGLGERVSAYGQIDFGLMTASSNVLHSYGFYDAENFNGYFGANRRARVVPSRFRTTPSPSTAGFATRRRSTARYRATSLSRGGAAWPSATPSEILVEGLPDTACTRPAGMARSL